MNCEHIENIVPYLLKYAVDHTKNCDGWKAQQFFGWELENLIDWNAVEDSKILSICDNTPFDGGYTSDEVHDYEVLYFNEPNGPTEMIAVSNKVGDRSDRNYYWAKSDTFAYMVKYLMVNFSLPPNINCTQNVLTIENQIAMSKSQYQSYELIDGEIYAHINNPTSGGLYTWNPKKKKDVRLLGADDKDELIDLGFAKDLKSMRHDKNSWCNDVYEITLENGDIFKSYFGWNEKVRTGYRETFWMERVML